MAGDRGASEALDCLTRLWVWGKHLSSLLIDESYGAFGCCTPPPFPSNAPISPLSAVSCQEHWPVEVDGVHALGCRHWTLHSHIALSDGEASILLEAGICGVNAGRSGGTRKHESME